VRARISGVEGQGAFDGLDSLVLAREQQGGAELAPRFGEDGRSSTALRRLASAGS
jgi:hypothetical protein